MSDGLNFLYWTLGALALLAVLFLGSAMLWALVSGLYYCYSPPPPRNYCSGCPHWSPEGCCERIGKPVKKVDQIGFYTGSSDDEDD